MSVQETISLDDGWKKINETVVTKMQSILEHNYDESLKKLEHMDAYTTCYNMCTQKSTQSLAEPLYNRYKGAVESYLTEKVLPAISSEHNESMLKQFVRRWNNHKILLKVLCHVFAYLDKFYVKRVSAPTLWEAGVNSFLVKVFDQVKERMQTSMLEMIAKERSSELVDRGLLKTVIAIFFELGQGTLTRYQEDFEAPYLSSTATYYSRQAAKWIGEDSCPEFLCKAEAAIEAELGRVSSYLHPETTEKVLKVIEQELLNHHHKELLYKEHSGCEVLLRDNKTEELSRMYRLFSRVQPGQALMAEIVKTHISESGLEIHQRYSQEKAEKSTTAYVQELLAVHDKYRELVSNCFEGHALFNAAMKNAFELFVNKDLCKMSTAEMISAFCDVILKKTGEKMGETELEETIDKVVGLFHYLSDKDLFAESYRKQLAKRLLLQRSSSDDAERYIITKLKYACGPQFTSKLEGMITDIGVSGDQHQGLKTYIKEKQLQLGLDLQVTVLTTGFWPTYTAEDVNLPAELGKCVHEFTTFYEQRTSHRRLRWVHNLGTAVLNGSFDKSKHELTVSTYQACILLLFNAQTSYTMSEIVAAVKLPEEELKKYLATLIGHAQSKYKVLVKSPPDPKALELTDVYTFNNAFTDKSKKIKMSLIMTKVSAEEAAATRQTVSEDRKHAVEAAIVRVMKSRRTLEHNRLVSEVSQQLMQHFKPDPKHIKQRIEDLIQREFLERNKDQSQVYNYLA